MSVTTARAMRAFPGSHLVMMTCAFVPNGGMTTEPGPDDCAIGVAGAVEAGPPGLNAGGGAELQAARKAQAAVSRAARRGRLMRLMSSRTGGARR